MTGITVARAGRDVVAVKRAVDPDHRARLHHEAEMLSRIDHPGVVRLVDFRDGPPATLRTVFVGPDSWATCEPELEALAAVTATVADLHEAGLTHGALHPAHVLVDRGGAPVLCGLADAGPATPERIQADRTALAALVRSRAERGRGVERDQLVDAATTLDESALPIRAAIRLLDAGSHRVPVAEQRLPRTAAMAAGVAGLVAVAAGLLWFVRGGATPDAAEPLRAEATTTMTVADRSPPTTTPVPSESPESPPTPNPAAVLTVEHGGRRYGIGAPGDEIVIADWTCTGEPTPALLRPATGEVVVFTTWPTAGAALEPAVATVVDDAVEIATSDLPCPDLRIRTPDGSRLIDVPSP